MKVGELKLIIERLKDDDELVIPIKKMFGSIGPSPSTSVTSVISGFDWNKGKVFLYTEEPLHVGGDTYKKEQEKAHELSEALGFIWLSCTNKTLTDVQKLSTVKQTLKRFGLNT